MAAGKRRGRGPSQLFTSDQAGDVVKIDPHTRTLSAAVVDARGGLVAGEQFRRLGAGSASACGLGALVRAERALGRRARRRLGPAQRRVCGRR